jgi:hypothetical protein
LRREEKRNKEGNWLQEEQGTGRHAEEQFLNFIRGAFDDLYLLYLPLRECFLFFLFFRAPGTGTTSQVGYRCEF